MGGVENLLFPLWRGASAWYENQYRPNPNRYGYNVIERGNDTHLFWTRAYLAYTLSGMGIIFNISRTAGRASPIGLIATGGGSFALSAEFPLVCRGNNQEIRRPVRALERSYALPLESNHGT